HQPEVRRVVRREQVQLRAPYEQRPAEQRDQEAHPDGGGARPGRGGDLGGHGHLRGAVRCWCTSEMTTVPSPTAEATRVTGPARTSPTANRPGTLVSCGRGGRPCGSSGDAASVPVSTNPRRSRA